MVERHGLESFQINHNVHYECLSHCQALFAPHHTTLVASTMISVSSILTEIVWVNCLEANSAHKLQAVALCQGTTAKMEGQRLKNWPTRWWSGLLRLPRSRAAVSYIAMKIHNLCTNMIHFGFILIIQHLILAYLGSQVQRMDSPLNNPKKIAWKISKAPKCTKTLGRSWNSNAKVKPPTSQVNCPISIFQSHNSLSCLVESPWKSSTLLMITLLCWRCSGRSEIWHWWKV